MKKLLIILFSFLFFTSFIFPQVSQKVEKLKAPSREKLNFALDNRYKISDLFLSESFEDTLFPPSGWFTLPFFEGSGWTRETVGSPAPGWSSETISAPASGGNAVAYCTYGDNFFNDQALVTPIIENVQPSDTLAFYMRNQLERPDTIEIYYYYIDSTQNLQYFSTNRAVFYPNSSGVFNTGWLHYSLPLESIISTTSNIGFAFEEYVNNNLSSGGAISLDLVELRRGGIIITIGPTASTNSATNITGTTATLNGTVNPNNSSTDVFFEYGTTTDYGEEAQADQNPVTGSTEVNVSANITGLLSNTIYHYQIIAMNDNGIAVGEDMIFTTNPSALAPIITPGIASNITSSSATLNGTVNPNNSSTIVTFEYGTTTSYGDQIAAEQNPVTGATAVNVSANVTDLLPNTNYHYRILASNNGGEATGADDISFLTDALGSAPSVATTSATSVSSNSAVLNGVINPNGLITSVSFQYGTTTNYDGLVGADQSPINGGSNNVNVTATATGLQTNTLYHFRVLAKANGNTFNGSDATFTTSSNYPASITLVKTFSFNGLSQNSYRMIGLPGKINLPMANFITGTQKVDWNAFYDDGSETINLIEFNGQATFNFTPGKGFWILSKNPIVIPSQQVDPVNLTGNSFTIFLHNGWNIISNPFERSVNVADIRTTNGLDQNAIFYDFNGNFTTGATIFSPYEGYYFFNDGNHSSLNIPYPFISKRAKIENSEDNEIFSGTYLKLSLIINNQLKSFVVAGFNSSTTNDYDRFDYPAPPGNFEEVRIHIEDNNLSIPYKQLFIDYRPGINEGQLYNLKIKNSSKKVVTLVAEGLENFAGDEIYLLDENLSRFYNLKEKNVIDVSPIHQNNNYKLLIGNENFINNFKKDFVPTEYSLYQNYPNPFNPSTIIRYQIPNNNTFVELKIYSIIGEEIKTLVNEVQEQGIYEIEFNAANLSSNIYFYSIKAGDFSSTKKMILLK